MTKCTTTSKRMIAILLSIILTVSGLASIGMTANAVSATNGIVKGADVPNVENSYTTVLSSGESTTIKIVNSILTIKVGASDYTFQIGNITKTTDAAVINEKDGLLHILTLGGAYYVFDLYTGVQIVAYRNMSNGKYCSSRNSYAYMVYGKSLINNTYFYELLTSNSVVRELLMSRYEFDIIVGGGDPSIEIVEPPTVAPTQEPTQMPTCRPTVAPTQEPTEVPTCKPTIAPTQAPQPTVKPTEVPIQEPTQMPTCRPTVAPVQEPTEMPTCKPTMAPQPTIKPTEVPVQPTTCHIEVPTLKPIELPTISIKQEFDIDFWWKQYISGLITWEQFSQAVWQNQWVVTTDSTEQEITYYFYDETGKLIRTEKITTGKKVEAGEGQGTASSSSSGQADVNANASGTGNINGSSTINVLLPGGLNGIGNCAKSNNAKKSPKLNKVKLTVYVTGRAKKLILRNADGPVSWSRSNKRVKLSPYGKNSQYCDVKGVKVGKVTVTAKCKGVKYKVLVTVKKRHARVITSGKRIKLFSGKNRLHAWLVFSPKTGKLNWNGYKVKNVKTCGFIQKSWNVIFVTKSGKVYKLPKSTNGQKHKTRIKCGEKAISLNRDSYGFVKYVKTKCGGIKNVSGK